MYPESFKQQVVAEYEAGGVSLQALRRKYQIGGTTTVTKWLHRYGKGVEVGSASTLSASSADALHSAARLAALEAEVAYMREKVIVFETLVEVASDYVKMDIKKKFGPLLPEHLAHVLPSDSDTASH